MREPCGFELVVAVEGGLHAGLHHFQGARDEGSESATHCASSEVDLKGEVRLVRHRGVSSRFSQSHEEGNTKAPATTDRGHGPRTSDTVTPTPRWTPRGPTPCLWGDGDTSQQLHHDHLVVPTAVENGRLPPWTCAPMDFCCALRRYWPLLLPTRCLGFHAVAITISDIAGIAIPPLAHELSDATFLPDLLENSYGKGNFARGQGTEKIQ